MPAPKKTQNEDDLGAQQVKDARDEAREKGYEGFSPSTIPNREFALTTGPDSPSLADMAEGIAQQRIDDMKGSSA
mgnify:CR=1 FL=1